MGTDTEMATDNIWTLFQHFVAEMLAMYFQQACLSLFFVHILVKSQGGLERGLENIEPSTSVLHSAVCLQKVKLKSKSAANKARGVSI